MTWKKHFRTASSPLDKTANNNTSVSKVSKYTSILPEIYAGHPNRIQRYYQYEDMGRDSDISAALDTIADFCTQSEEQNDEPFLINYLTDPTESQVTVIKQALKQWVRANKFKMKIWKIIRDCAQYGDAFFIRDPEDHTWVWIDHYSVELVKMSEDGKQTPEEYVISNFNPNLTSKYGTNVDDISKYRTAGTTPLATTKPYLSASANSPFQMAGSEKDFRTRNGLNAMANSYAPYISIDGKHMVHLSLNEQMDINFPFGKSLLDPVFKTFKQKELLEDSIIIYRVQRAPERRIFYIDTGSMNPIRAQAYIEGIKNEIHQRRIPNRTGGGTSIMDTAYNPLCLDMNTRIPLLDGRTLTIEELAVEYRQGKENWVYSCDPNTGKIVPGNITWAGVTRRDAEVIKLTFDNGESLICTPDHKIPVWGKGFVEARNLTSLDKLINHETFTVDEHVLVFDHEAKSWEYTSNIVGNFFKTINKHQEFTFSRENVGQNKNTIVNKNLDTINNDPRNICFMNNHDAHEYISSQNPNYVLPTDLVIDSDHKNNRYVTKIEKIANMDTGTITIDGNERWHAHHTFAIESGIFVKNSILDDYFFSQSIDGRGSKVEVLPSGDALGEITDLTYFTKKMARGLRIPTSYLSLGGDEQPAAYNDGKLGAAMIQEYRFNKFCMRLQGLLAPTFDKFFKDFLTASGIQFEDDSFELEFNPPQNFTKYRQIELDAQQVQVYSQVAGNNKLAEQFKFERFLNLTPEEMIRNEKLWMEENPDAVEGATGSTAADQNPEGNLSSVGITGGNDFDLGGPEPDFGAPEAPAEASSDINIPEPTSAPAPEEGA